MTKLISPSLLLLAFLYLLPYAAFSQKEALRKRMEEITQTAKGKVGVAVLGIEDRDTLSVFGKDRFPMQSVYKFPVAIAVLHQVDQRKLSLQQKIHLRPEDLLPNTWSPLREKYPQGNVDIPLSEVLLNTVALSDNNGCDVLFRLLGGPPKVDAYIRSLGVRGMAIAATEEQMHQEEQVQYTNWSEPTAMLRLLDVFYARKALSPASTDFLWKVMVETSTGPRRMKGLLPPGTIVAHKTGSSGTNSQGITAATNDVGIVTLPNGKHVALVVFVSDASADEATREGVIAQITKAVWDYFVAKP
nr:VEB-PER_beta_lactamase [uncultured bacterium]